MNKQTLKKVLKMNVGEVIEVESILPTLGDEPTTLELVEHHVYESQDRRLTFQLRWHGVLIAQRALEVTAAGGASWKEAA